MGSAIQDPAGRTCGGDAVVVPLVAVRRSGTQPAAPGRSVIRVALVEGLVRARARAVVLSAPAGAGKSTVLGQWLASDPREQVVIRADRALNDPAALAWAMVDALEPQREAAASLRALVATSEPQFSSVLLPTLTQLAASRPRPYLVAIDDAHLLDDVRCQEVLRAVCEGVPDGSCLAVAMRPSAPRWLARARAADSLLEVGPRHFAFSPAEAAELFEGLGLEASPAQVAAAVEATEGWAVALYLAGVAATNGPVIRRDLTVSGNTRFVRDYLLAEVLDELGDETRRFLRRTSVLDELTGEVCDAITESTGSAALLDGLHRRLQLVIPLDREGHRYRYHHVLQDLLRASLRREEPDVEATLHGRAARWYADRDQLDTAVGHAKAAHDLPLAAELIWCDIAANVGGNRHEQLRQRLAGLTDHELASERWLTLEACWVSLQGGDFDRATRWLCTAQSHVGPDWRAKVRSDPYAAQLALPTALIGHAGLAESVSLCDDALSVLAADEPLRAGLMFLRGVSEALLGEVQRGSESLQEAERYARALGVPIVVADSLCFRGLIALLSGDTEHAYSLIGAGTATIRDNQFERLASGVHSLTAQALLLATQHDPAAAEALTMARRMTAAVPVLTTWFQSVGRLLQARAAILLGDAATARLLISEAREHMTPELQASLAQDLLDSTEAALHTVAVSGMPASSLSTAELRVVQFLPSHLSFRQIGEHLFLSENTVKTHAKSIYAKLGASSRAEAVERAQSLGLVDAPRAG